MKYIAKLFLSMSMALLLILALNTTTQAKSGNIKGNFGWYAIGQIFEIEENHVFWVGEFTGAFFDDDSSGLFGHVSTKCPARNDLIGGISHSEGYCIMTDAEGDKAVLSWQCEGPVTGKCEGDFNWSSGTGKFAGINGKNSKFHAVFITMSEGYAVWDATYNIP